MRWSNAETGNPIKTGLCVYDKVYELVRKRFALFVGRKKEMKETYKVKRPGKVIFGDPLYFRQYSEEERKRLIVDIEPPNYFVARVTIEEIPVAACPDGIGRLMSIYLAPEETIETYMQNMIYEGQDLQERKIGVDSAKYRLTVDDQALVIPTGGDGYWGGYEEYSRMIGGRRLLDAAKIAIVMPDKTDTEEMRQYVHLFFKDVQQIENVGMPESFPLQEEQNGEDDIGPVPAN